MPPDGFINGALAAEAEQPATSTAAPAAAPPDPYNIQAALKAGYNVTEITDYLGRNGVNVGAARQAGYLDDEIVSHLIGRAPEPEPEPPAKPAEPVSSTLVGAGKALAQVPTDFAGGLIKAGGNIDRAAGTALQAGARHSGDFASQQLDIIDKIDAGEPFAMPSTGQNSRDQAMNEFGQAYAGSDADTRAAIRQRITGEVAVKPEDTLLSQAGGGLKALGDTIHGAGEAVTGFGERMVPLTQEEQGRFSVQGIKLLGGMAPYAVAALGGPVAVATLAGVQGFSDTYDAAKKAGSSDEDAAAAGLLGGIADAGLMIVPMHQAVRVLDRIPKMFKGEFLKGIIESAKGAGSFVGFAELQKIADNVIAQNTYDPSRPAMQHVGENLGLEAAVGAFLPFAALAGRTGGRLALRGLDRVLPAGPTLDINPHQPPEPPPPRPADVMAAPDLDSAIKTAEQAAGAPTEDAAYDEPTPQAGPASTSTALVTQPTPVDVRSEVDQLSTGSSRDLAQASLLRLFANTGRGAVEQNQDGSYQFRTTNEAGDEVTHPIAVYYPSPAAQTAPGPDQRTPVTAEQADVIRQHYGQAGVNVVFYQDHKDIPFDGAVDPNQPNTIFLSSNPQRALVQVAGHEFGHILTNTTLPDGTSLGDLLHQQIAAGLTNAGQKHAERMFGWAAPKRADFANDADWVAAVQAHLVNEMGAEIAGEAPKFSSFAGRVIDAVQARWGDGVAADVLRKLMDGLRAAMQSIREMFGGTNTRSRNWVSNIEDVHDTLAKMYAERFGSPLERERAAHETAVDKVERDALVAQPKVEDKTGGIGFHDRSSSGMVADTLRAGDQVRTDTGDSFTVTRVRAVHRGRPDQGNFLEIKWGDGRDEVMKPEDLESVLVPQSYTSATTGERLMSKPATIERAGSEQSSEAPETAGASGALTVPPAEPTPTDTGLSEPVGTVGTPAKRARRDKGLALIDSMGITQKSRGEIGIDEVGGGEARPPLPTPPPHPDRSPEMVAAVQAIADRWEHELGNPGMARAVRAGLSLPPRPNDPPDAIVAFQQGLLDREIAKRGGTAPKPQETFSMDQFMSHKGDMWTRFKAVATDEARELLNAAEAAAQKQTDRINALGWSTEEIGRGSPPAAVKDLKDTLTTLWALSSRFVAGEVASVRGYKRANPAGFSALTGELRRVIDRINGTSRPDVASWEDVRDGLHGNARQQRRWLDELATERDAAAKATPQARLLQQTEAAILRPVDGNEADLPPAAKDRLEQVRAKIDEVTHPEADTPPMAKVRGELAKTSEALVQHTTKKGKVLTGTVRTDLDQAGAKKLDPFTFKKDGGWFIRQGRGEAPQESTPSPESKPEQPRAEQTRPSPESGAEQPQPERPSDYGANNKTFTKEAADKARERLRAKLNRLNAGFDPEMAFDGLVLAGFHIEAGARKFRDYARAMIEDLGNAARPHLAQWYTAVRMQHGFDARGMDDAGAVELWQKGMDARAAALAKPVPGRDVTIFRSGANAPADFRGYVEAGVPVGVSLAKMSPNSATNQLLLDYARKGGQVFVDSGAFTAFTRGTPVDFAQVLERQLDLAKAADGARLHFVMPDVIGDQAESLRLITAHADSIKELIRLGQDVMVPLQKGEMAPRELFAAVRQVLGTSDFTAAIPFNKVPFSHDDLRDLFAGGDGPQRVHLLGIAGRQNALAAATAVIREAGGPNVAISADASRINAGVGEGRAITEGQKQNLTRLLEDLWGGQKGLEAVDETELAGELASTPDFLTPEQARDLAESLGVPASDHDSWVDAAHDGTLGELLDQQDGDGRATMHWLRQQYQAIAEKAARGRARTEAVTEHDVATMPGSQSLVPAPEPVNAPAPAAHNPDHAVAERIATRLDRQHVLKIPPFGARELQNFAEEAHGGTLAQGAYTRDRLYDALELGVNRYIQRNPERFSPAVDAPRAMQTARELADLKASLPTQTVRAGEKDAYQQFSTPPDYAYAASWVANLQPSDHVLEPSAGVGGLIVHAMNAGVRETTANELSDKRRGMIALLNPTRVTGEDAAQLHNILPDAVRPTAVMMNPPFSRAAERMGGRMVADEGATHIEQALARLEPGGRLVAIVGDGMKPEGTGPEGGGRQGTGKAFADWWRKIGAEYDVRANVGVDRDIYTKYGTSFPTRFLVIDKNPPSGRPMVTGQVADAAGLIERLKDVRDERSAVQPVADQSGRAEVATGGADVAGPDGELHSSAGGVGPGTEPGGTAATDLGEPADTGRGGTDGAGPAGLGDTAGGSGQPVVPEQSELRPGGSGRPAGGRAGTGRNASRRGGGGSADGIRADGSGERVEPGLTPAPEPVLAVENATAKPDNQAVNEAVYEAYKPQRVQITGAKPHPGALVQSAAMATVLPPATDYRPRLPVSLVKGGALSDAQLEAIVYAGHAHSDVMADGKRRGFFIGDGTGVGKGREIAGIILDNFQNGRKKAIWISEKRALLNDAKRDWNGLNQPATDVIDHGKLKAGDPIKGDRGILFSSYDTLKSAEQTKTKDGKVRGKERVDQIIEWVGRDFDGVIAFDEAHNMGNSQDEKGNRGIKKASQKALAAVRLQKELPNARVVYVSATGATEVTNLAYADRLGLWGEGTAFANRGDFIGSVSSGGIAGMELVARDMKALGHYIARNLSYDGVDYDRVEHTLTADQRVTYDKLAEGWQLVLQNINEALVATGAVDEDTGKSLNGKARAAAMSAFWGAHQRFFNQIITSMQMPSVVRGVEADIKAGRQAVLQLVNTMEAAQERALDKARQSGEGELEDLDMTPRDQLMQMIERSFPVQQYEDYLDDNGNKRSRPVVDSAGKPVLNREAVAARDRLLDQVGSLRVPDGPLEILLNHFGIDKVAEVTGRGQRVVRKPDETGEIKTQVEQRGAQANIAEANAFQAGKKPILVFSEAGGTGRSYHAAIGSGSENARRSHYLVQGGWRADKAVQGFGRTHRTSQASAPIFHLVTTDLQGQKRFISSIARRLAQLGALTKGERRAADQGMFSARDNLESTEARLGLQQFFKDVDRGEVEGVTMEDLEKSMGLKMHDDNGALLTPEMSQFLNRVLSLTIDHQNRVFQAFSDRMDTAIARASAAGTLDTGVETYKADKISKVSEQVVYTDPRSGAETKHVHLNAQNRNEPVSFEETLAGRNKTGGMKPDSFVQNNRSGRVFAVTTAGNYTDKDGRVVPQARLTGPIDYQFIDRDKVTADGWKRLATEDARPLWDKQVADTPEFRNSALHIITGAVLPIWDRLGGNPKIFRLQTDTGERMLGRVVPSTQVDATLRALGAEGIKVTAKPAEVAQRVLGGATATLANGWTIRRSLVAGESRLELVGPDYRFGDELARSGVFSERINYATRYFIPTGADAARAIEGITKTRPITALDGGVQYSPRVSDEFEEGRAPLYSALTRAVEGVKQDKAAPGQWLATLKNMPGVKPEERAWTGLDDWLGKQPKSVTKAEVLDYLRANQIRVQEVVHGGEDSQAVVERAREAHYDAREQLADTRERVSSALAHTRHQVEINGDRLWDDELLRSLEGGYITPEQVPEDHGLRAASASYVDAYKAAEAAYEAYDNARRYQPTGAVTKYHSYTLPGGENYREMLLTLPVERVDSHYDLAQKMFGKRWDELSSAQTDAVLAELDRRAQTPNQAAARSYRSSHWNEPNVVAHMRFSERAAPDGARVLHVEEVQSDWHQEGRRRGYDSERKTQLAAAEAERQAALTAYESAKETEAQAKREVLQADDAMRREGSSYQRSVARTDIAFDEAQNIRRRRHEFPTLEAYRAAEAAAIERRDQEMDRHRAEIDAGAQPEFTAWRQAQDRYGAAYEALRQSVGRYNDAVANLDMQRGQTGRGVPDAPFKTTWPMLAMKRMITWAVDHDFDRVAWTPGEAQADRYDLSQRIERIEYNEQDGRFKATQVSGDSAIRRTNVTPEQLPNLIGKEAADRIMAQTPVNNGTRVLSGLDLKVGGEGMKGFYDRQLPTEVQKLVGKYGAKVGASEITVTEPGTKYVGPEPTPEQMDAMRAAFRSPERGNRISPITGREAMFDLSRASNEYAMRELEADMRSGMTFSEAMGRSSPDIAELFGGSIVADDKAVPTRVHSFDITDQLRDAVQSQGLPLFSPKATVRNQEEAEQWTPEEAQAYDNVGRIKNAKSVIQRVKDWFVDRPRKEVQAWLDPYISVKRDDPHGYVALRNANTTSGALQAFMEEGTLRFNGSTYAMASRNGGVIDHLIRPLRGEADKFFWWVAANRAEQLTAEDRENLFTQQDIDTLKQTNQGQLAFDYQLPNGQVTRSREVAYNDSLRKKDIFDHNVLDLATRSGLISDDVQNALIQNPFYVPFYRLADDDGHFAGPSITSGFVKQYAFKALKGGKEKLNNDLWDNAIKNWAHMIDAALRNRAAAMVLDVAQTNGAVTEVTQRQYDHMGKADRKNTVWIMNDGKKQYFLVDDPMLLTAISALTWKQDDPLMRAAQKFRTTLTAGVTADPRFMLRNFIRDAQQAMAVSPLSLNVFGNVRRGFAQADVGRATMNLARAMVLQETKKVRRSDRAADLLAGGGLMNVGAGDTGARQVNVKTILGPNQQPVGIVLDSPDRISAFWHRLRTIAHSWKRVGEESEDIQRYAIYDKLLDEGAPHDYAAFSARDLTDFSLRGAGRLARTITTMVPFLNARLQGLYKVARSAADADRSVAMAVGRRVAWSATTKLAIALAVHTLLGLALDAIYADDEDYKKRSDYDRATYFWFKIGKVQISIPKGFEIAALSQVAINGIEAFFGWSEMTGQRFNEQLWHLLGTNLSMNPMPQFLKPIADLWQNQNFAGTPIVPKGLDQLQPEYRYTQQSTLPARAISDIGNRAGRAVFGQGTQFLSPLQIDYLVQGYFGWLGAQVMNVADLTARGIDQAQAALRGVKSIEPVRPDTDLWATVTGGMIRTDPSRTSRYVDMLYQQGDAVKEAYATYRMKLASGHPEEAATFAQKNKDLLVQYGRITSAERTEADLNRAIKQVAESQTLSGEQKRLRIMQYNAQRNRAAENIFGSPRAAP